MAASRILRRSVLFLILAIGLLYGLYSFNSISAYTKTIAKDYGFGYDPKEHVPLRDSFRKWRNIPLKFPVGDFVRLPEGDPAPIPRIQHDFSKYRESPMHSEEREKRRRAVREAFQHSWTGYKTHAWLHDEVKPISGEPSDPFGAWGATLIDSLDTLWIMGLEDEFNDAVNALKLIDFTKSSMDHLNVFETVIRYIGGMLGAYDISGGKHLPLLHKAIELGEMVYHAFDTPNHMPISRWDWKLAEAGEEQRAPMRILIAELGSLTLEFTRLTQLTGDPKYYDAVQRITQLLSREQSATNIPGLWPIMVNALKEDLHTDVTFTMGGMADSVYEYLPKEYLLLGGRDETYKDMYNAASEAMKRYLVYEPLIPLQRQQGKEEDTDKNVVGPTPAQRPPTDDKGDKMLPPGAFDRRDYEFSPDYANPLLLGTASGFANGEVRLTTEGQHLSCFAGGMAALGVRAFAPFNNISTIEEDMDVAERLTAGCVWAYRATATGIAPEIFHASYCRRGRAAVKSGGKNETDWTGEEPSDCRWERERWLSAVRHENLGDGDMTADSPMESSDLERWEGFVKEHHLAEGFTSIVDSRYMLRPEAIESVFMLWRISGDPKYQDQAWAMFQAIDAIARTKIGYASVADVTVKPQSPADRRGLGSVLSPLGLHDPREGPSEFLDNMESFWTAETLKYFYLVFAEPDVVSLDEFVLNTEAHPFRWRKGPPALRNKADPYKHFGNNN